MSPRFAEGAGEQGSDLHFCVTSPRSCPVPVISCLPLDKGIEGLSVYTLGLRTIAMLRTRRLKAIPIIRLSSGLDSNYQPRPHEPMEIDKEQRRGLYPYSPRLLNACALLRSCLLVEALSVAHSGHSLLRALSCFKINIPRMNFS